MIEDFRKIRKRLLATLLLLCVLAGSISIGAAGTAYAAPGWGSPGEIKAGAAIVMDADTGAILYGKEMNRQCYPASITKIMTALLVIENCDLDETVTFSKTAVSDLEAGAVTAFTSEGDTLSVRDCLYALLFRSANEVANALAEHVSGSVEAFADLMNEKAKALGCKNTHFVNPNGLSSTEHVTTAYDMALIARACMDNKTFLELESKDSHKIAGTKERPDGLTVTIGHKMLRDGTAYSDSRVVGGKTGFTTASGNTLVTMAEDGGRRLVAVVMEDKTPNHYLDTKAMLDFGFSAFENKKADALLDKKKLEQRLVTDKIIPEGGNALKTDRAFYVSLPKGAELGDVASDYEYNLPDAAPKDAVASLKLSYGDHTAGTYYIENDRESVLSLSNISEAPPAAKVAIGISLTAVLAAAGTAAFFLLGGGTAYVHMKNVREEKMRLRAAKQRRKKRLESMGVSDEEFQKLMDEYQERHEKRQQEKGGKKRGK